jgi:hypothetical protein
MKATVTLSGGGADVDVGDVLTYHWTIVTTPAKSKVALSSDTAQSPTFVPDKKGTYVFSLVVNDGTVDSVADTVTITAATGK